MSLEDDLRDQGRLRWLDVGSGGRADPGFDLLDTFPAELFRSLETHAYYRADIVNLADAMADHFATYDLVRAQHVLEHLTFEDGLRAIVNCARFLKPGGVLIATVPDLAIHARWYLEGGYRAQSDYVSYATERIPEDAPDSAYFSMFAHSLLMEPHQWCYDFEGLAYQFKRSGVLQGVRRLSLGDEFSAVPFTHNRPNEDVCVMGVRI